MAISAAAIAVSAQPDAAGAGADERHSPSRPLRSQRSVELSQASLQQKPSAQNPEMHCDGVEQAAPSAAGVGVLVAVAVAVAGGGGPHAPIGIALQTPPAVKTPWLNAQVMNSASPPSTHSSPS